MQKKLKNIVEAAYKELLETDITATPPIHINTPKKVKSPIAKEILKLRKSGSSDSEIIEYLLDTDGLTKPVTPKSNEQEIRAKLKRQDVIFTATTSNGYYNPIAVKSINHKNS